MVLNEPIKKESLENFDDYFILMTYSHVKAFIANSINNKKCKKECVYEPRFVKKLKDIEESLEILMTYMDKEPIQIGKEEWDNRTNLIKSVYSKLGSILPDMWIPEGYIK